MLQFLVVFLLIVHNSIQFSIPEPRSVFKHLNQRQRHYSSGYGIINGQVAKPHQFPYQVGIFVQYKQYADFCGGSLISNNYVLTAAHCVENAVSTTLVFGAHNVTDATENTQVRLQSTSFKLHESWSSNDMINDIALIKLPTSVKETAAIKIVNIVSGTNAFSGQTGTVTGWGLTQNKQTQITQDLRYATGSILSNTDCKKFDDYDIIKDSHLCLAPGTNKVGTCQGDSGGPLVVDGKQVGIVSFGPTDCQSGQPSVFTRITQFSDWIVKNSDAEV